MDKNESAANDPSDSRLDSALLDEMMSILERDVPDPIARHNIALMLRAHVRSRFTHSLRDLFEPYIGINGTPPDTVDDAVQIMRDAVIRIAGYSRDEGKDK